MKSIRIKNRTAVFCDGRFYRPGDEAELIEHFEGDIEKAAALSSSVMIVELDDDETADDAETVQPGATRRRKPKEE